MLYSTIFFICYGQYTPINVQSNNSSYGQGSRYNEATTYQNNRPSVNKYGYVDLGLPSGTLWKTSNESGYYSKDELYEFGYNLPSSDQWEELMEYCSWKWTGNGYRITGQNGKSIHLPCAGYRNAKGETKKVSEEGYYWLSNRTYTASYLKIYHGHRGLHGSSYLNCEYSVRLVSN